MTSKESYKEISDSLGVGVHSQIGIDTNIIDKLTNGVHDFLQHSREKAEQAQNREYLTTQPKEKALVADKKPIEKITPKPIVQATLPTSLDEFMAGAEPSSAKKTSPPKTDIKPKLTAKNMTHTVKSGDTLSAIANKYGVSMQSIRDLNKLKDDNVKLDTTLKIPQS